MTTEFLCFYLQNRLIKTSQTGGKQYSDTSPFSIPCSKLVGFVAVSNFQIVVIKVRTYLSLAQCHKGKFPAFLVSIRLGWQ